MRYRKTVRRLVLCLGIGLFVLLGALWVHAVRQPSVEDRIHQATLRANALNRRVRELKQADAPLEQIEQSRREERKAWDELKALLDERARLWDSWPARFRRELERRTGW
jgi:hypothetical protein